MSGTGLTQEPGVLQRPGQGCVEAFTPVAAPLPDPTAAPPYVAQRAWHLAAGPCSTYPYVIAHSGDARAPAMRYAALASKITMLTRGRQR
jgi:hypothetical protein